MGYKNLLIRSLVSLIFLFIYTLLFLYDFELIFYLIILIYITICFEIFFNFKIYRILAFLYVLVSLILFLNIDFNQTNFKNFNLLIVIIITFDICSYLFGKKFGKIKILPKISPNKTLEGLAGGSLFSIIFAFAYFYFFDIYYFSLNIFLFLIVTIFSAFIGDVIESFFKRINNLKDSSSLLPGHGGFFDRFDSFIFSIISYYFLYNLL